jgi:hypothetical protein
MVDHELNASLTRGGHLVHVKSCFSVPACVDQMTALTLPTALVLVYLSCCGHPGYFSAGSRCVSMTAYACACFALPQAVSVRKGS